MGLITINVPDELKGFRFSFSVGVTGKRTVDAKGQGLLFKNDAAGASTTAAAHVATRAVSHEYEFFEKYIKVEDSGTTLPKVCIDDLMAGYKRYCLSKNYRVRCYVETLGKALREWLKLTLPREPYCWAAGRIEAFLEPERFQYRAQTGGERKRWYRGVTLLRDPDRERDDYG